MCVINTLSPDTHLQHVRWMPCKQTSGVVQQSCWSSVASPHHYVPTRWWDMLYNNRFDRVLLHHITMSQQGGGTYWQNRVEQGRRGTGTLPQCTQFSCPYTHQAFPLSHQAAHHRLKPLRCNGAQSMLICWGYPHLRVCIIKGHT